MKILKTLQENARKNIWQTISIILTGLAYLIDALAGSLDLDWLTTAGLIVSALLIFYNNYIIPNFSEEDMIGFGNHTASHTLLRKSAERNEIDANDVENWIENYK